MNWSHPFLEGLCVVELGARTAAGACGQLFAMLGATVHVCRPVDVTGTHKWAYPDIFCHGKQVVSYDPAQWTDAFKRLAGQADVFILSTDLPASERHNLDRLASPRAVVCDITAFGQSGPLQGAAYSEGLIQALAGHAATTGDSDGPPTITGAPFLDMQTAVYSASAILAALRCRDMTGAGQKIDMAIYDVAVNAMLTFIPLHLTGGVPGRTGNRHPTLAPWNSYAAKDGAVLICAPTNDQWRRLCEAMEMPETCADARFADPAARLRNVGQMNHMIAGWVGTQTVGHCLDRLASFNVPSGTVADLQSMLNESNLRHRNMVHCLEPAGPGQASIVPGSPVKMGPELRQRLRDRLASRTIATPAPSAALDGLPAARALAGMRVVEIGTNTVGPLAARQLAALGAEVIKVEPPAGDPARANAPFRADGQSYAFALSNTDKLGMVLDLRNAEHKERLLQLLEGADILIENLKPGSLDKLGLGAASLAERFPRLIYCSINGFGYDTVYPGRPALDSVIQGMSGIMAAAAGPEAPCKTGVSTSDLLGGQFGLLAVLAADFVRRRHGCGVRLDLAMQDCSAWATQTLWNGPVQPSAALIETSDGWIAVDTGPASPQAAVHLRADQFRQLPREAAAALAMELTGCHAAPVLTLAEMLAHPQTAARGLLQSVPAADGSRWTVLRSPLGLRSTPAEVRRAMPPLGAADPVLAAAFGLPLPA